MAQTMTLEEAVKCAQSFAYSGTGSICGGCSMSSKCGIHTMLRERREVEQAEYDAQFEGMRNYEV